MLLLQLCRLFDFQPKPDIGERFRSDLSYRNVGVGRPDSG
jgi:hypothetical protein